MSVKAMATISDNKLMMMMLECSRNHELTHVTNDVIG
jgi:hypothetical protein